MEAKLARSEKARASLRDAVKALQEVNAASEGRAEAAERAAAAAAQSLAAFEAALKEAFGRLAGCEAENKALKKRLDALERQVPRRAQGGAAAAAGRGDAGPAAGGDPSVAQRLDALERCVRDLADQRAVTTPMPTPAPAVANARPLKRPRPPEHRQARSRSRSPPLSELSAGDGRDVVSDAVTSTSVLVGPVPAGTELVLRAVDTLWRAAKTPVSLRDPRNRASAANEHALTETLRSHLSAGRITRADLGHALCVVAAGGTAIETFHGHSVPPPESERSERAHEQYGWAKGAFWNHDHRVTEVLARAVRPLVEDDDATANAVHRALAAGAVAAAACGVVDSKKDDLAWCTAACPLAALAAALARFRGNEPSVRALCLDMLRAPRPQGSSSAGPLAALAAALVWREALAPRGGKWVPKHDLLGAAVRAELSVVQHKRDERVKHGAEQLKNFWAACAGTQMPRDARLADVAKRAACEVRDGSQAFQNGLVLELAGASLGLDWACADRNGVLVESTGLATLVPVARGACAAARSASNAAAVQKLAALLSQQLARLDGGIAGSPLAEEGAALLQQLGTVAPAPA